MLLFNTCTPYSPNENPETEGNKEFKRKNGTKNGLRKSSREMRGSFLSLISLIQPEGGKKGKMVVRYRQGDGTKDWRALTCLLGCMTG